MTKDSQKIFLNRFPVKKLADEDKTVVFKQVKKSIDERFSKSTNTAQWLSEKIYNSTSIESLTLF